MAFLTALPATRAPLPDEEHRQGLRRTEEYLLGVLTDMGYEPRTEEIRLPQASVRSRRAGEAGNGLPAEPRPRDAEQGEMVGRPAPDEGPAAPEPPWRNIIVEVRGRVVPDEVLLVGAHVDAVPGSPGADDNGSGVAALLEAARVLRHMPLKRTVRLAFFNLEETGLQGSRHHLRQWRRERPGERLIGMVSLEMLGYYSDRPGSQRSPIPPIEGLFDPPTVGNFLGIATISRYGEFARAWARGMQAAEPTLPVVVADMFPIPPPDFLRSDHAPFLLAGYPALMLTDTANFRNPHYHRPTDTVETLDRRRYMQAVRAVVGAMCAIAEPAGGPDDHVGAGPGK